MTEGECKCMRIGGHLEAVPWNLWPREYKPSVGAMALADWTTDEHIWLHYVESSDGTLADDDVLRSTDTRYWSIHDVQRYFVGRLHCEQVLFTLQYPNLRLPTRLGSHLWNTNTALKLSPTVFMKELHTSFETTLKKMEAEQVQINRMLLCDQLIKIDRLDFFKRKTFFRLVENIMSFQDNLELVSLENLCCRRLEGARLVQQLACYNAHSLKYLFLWRFVLPNENPLLVNYSYISECLESMLRELLPWLPVIYPAMATDEEKSKLAKLLQDLEVPEVKIPERCSELVKEFEQKYTADIKNETLEEQTYDNPYVVDTELLEENEKKLQQLLAESKRAKREIAEITHLTVPDPKRPWRTQSNKEKLLRIDHDLKRHTEKASLAIAPLGDGEMRELVRQCQKESLVSPPVCADRLRETVDEARRNLPNFQYRKIENSTATDIMPTAHGKSSQMNENPAEPYPVEVDCLEDVQIFGQAGSGQYIPRPDTRRCFLRSLSELRNLRLLALEYAHIADGTGYAIMALLPVIRRPHFRLQLICREGQTPGRAQPERGAGGLGVPDTAWRRVQRACPDLYLLMAFYRLRDYDDVRRFLTPSMVLREAHLEYGIDLLRHQRQHSDISCFVRHLAHQYGDTLVTLSIHQWRGAVFPLRKMFELMPGLVRLFYVGLVDEHDLRATLDLVACGVVRKLKQLHIKVQDEESSRERWARVLPALADHFHEVMDLLGINFCLGVYKN